MKSSARARARPHQLRVALPFSAIEEARLRRLVDQAFDLRSTPYLRDACEAICQFNETTLPDRLARQAESAAA